MVRGLFQYHFMSNIFIVIPAYNEAKHVSSVIDNIKNVNSDFNIVVVDDCSDDNTYDVAVQSDVQVLKHVINRGQGAALKTGTEYAIIKGADIIVHFDADGQFLAADIPNVIAPIIAHEADIVFGSRFMGKPSNMPILKKYFLMPIINIIQRKLFNIHLTDPQSGFRAFNVDIFPKIYWRSDHMAHCSEILHLSFSNKLRVQEVAVTVIYNEFGQTLFNGLNIIKDSFLNIFLKH